MPSVFDYLDFKAYLRDYYKERKNANCFFSYQVLTEKAGFNNKGFVYNIIKGTKKLTRTHCYRLSQALLHTKKEADYFATIVAYAQAKNEGERSFFMAEALRIANATGTQTMLLEKDHFEFYSTWYHSAVRSLINLFPVSDNFTEAGKMLSPPVTASQVKKSIRLLERLGMIEKNESGVYRLVQKSIRTSREISQVARTDFHRQCTDLAKQALGTIAPDKRNAVSITLGLSQKTYRDVVAETDRFVATLTEIIGRDATPPERVYQYELLLFPLSKENGKPGQQDA